MADIDTWMPWHIAEYLADTMHLSTLEHGAYLLILGHGWRNGGTIVAGDAHLAGVTRLPKDQWKAIKPTLERFFEAFDHPTLGACWKQKRQVEEIQIAKAQKAGAAERTKNATEARRRRRDDVRDEQRDDVRNDVPRGGKGRDLLDLPPEEIALYRPPLRSEESAAHGAAIKAAAMDPARMTQAHIDRATAVSKLYPIRSKEGRNVRIDIAGLNILAGKIAAAPDFPWDEAAKLENLNETPLDLANWVSSQPDPILLEARRRQAATPPPLKPGERPVRKSQALT